MASTTVTITIEEADVPRVVKAICNHAGVTVENANAKPALVKMVKGWVVDEQRREAAITPPNLT